MNEISKLEQNSRKEPVNPDNYLRKVQQVNYDGTDNLKYWEPLIQVLSEDEIKKHEVVEERKYRLERRERGKKYMFG